MAGGTNEDSAGFGGHLADAGRAMLTQARHALENASLSEPERVHELRKAFKRWRAFLRLLGGPIGAPAEDLRIKARDLMRTLSGARDAQGALDAVDDLAGAETGLSPRTLKTIRARLAALRDTAENAALTAQTRRAIALYLEEATQTLAAWPLENLDFSAVADGLAATYRRARQLAPSSFSDVDPVHLHALRRRVVEHRHQMELIEPLWPRVTKAWSDEAQRLRNRLGACQDLSVLSGFVAPHQPLAAWRSRLMPLIEAQRERHLKTAARLASRLFAEKPKAFRQRVAALWTAHARARTAKK